MRELFQYEKENLLCYLIHMSHLNAEQYEEDLEEVIDEQKEAGVTIYGCRWI